MPEQQTTTRLTAARLIAAATTEVPGVQSLDGGAVGEFATYAAGTRCAGVRVTSLDPLTGEVRVAVDYGARIPEVARTIRQVVADQASQELGLGEVVLDIRVTAVVAPTDMDADGDPQATP